MDRGVIITLDNGALGRTQGTEDGIFGIIFQVPVMHPCSFAMFANGGNGVKAINSLKEAETLWAITEGNDATTGSDLWSQIRDFYSFSGNLNRKLWIAIVTERKTTQQLVDTMARTLLNAAQGEISVLFLCNTRDTNSLAGTTYVNGIDSTVSAALASAQTLAEEYALLVRPIRIVLDAGKYNGTDSALANLTASSYNRVAINLATNRASTNNACQGLLAGRMAFTPVNESIGWVQQGALPITAGYLTSGQTYESQEAKINGILDKGFIMFQKYPTLAGYFFCDPKSASSRADDYHPLTNGRTIDKAHKLAYNTFVKYVNAKLYVEKDGTINLLQIKGMEADIENVINQQMVAKGECSFVKCVIDPNQKVLQTNELVIGVKIIPTATLELIRVKLGFTSSI